MGTRHRLVRIGQRVVALVATVMLMLGTFSCAKPTEPTQLIEAPTVEPNRLTSKLAEVSPPETIQTLKQVIDAYTPQVRILSPRPGEIVEDTSVSLRVQVRGLPIFKDETFGLGPHLHVFLDNEPYQAVYDLSKPLEFKDLSPGTHTLRVFASRPWHESFKNQGAFDQRTFHIYAPTPQDELSADQPVLTYSRPQGTYGAEPIMLDFYLTNAPLHMTAQEDPKDDIPDWRIRCTVNGQSFVFDEWQAVYLKGFEPGRNWVQLELIDEAGEPIDNRFNNTIRVIDYEPGGTGTLSKLVRGELALKEVAGIIDPTYEPPVEPEPEETVPEAEGIPQLEEAIPETKEGVPAEEITPADREATEADEGASEVMPEPETAKEVPTQPPSPVPVVPPLAPETPDAEEPQVETPEQQPRPETMEIPEKAAEGQPIEPEAPAVELEQPELPMTESPGPPDSEEVIETQLEEQVTLDKQPSGQQESGVDEQMEDVLGEDTQAEEQNKEPKGTDNSNELRKPEVSEPKTRDDSTEPSTGNKLLERYKRWQQHRQSNQTEAEQSVPESDSDRVDVFLSPDTETPPPLSQPEGPESDDSRMEMPELVEPYLTEPYLTEPRLDLAIPEEEPSDETSEETSPKRSTPNSENGDGSEKSVQTNPDRPLI